MKQSEYISVGEAATLLGVAVVTMRRWEKQGKLKASFRTFGNHRRYLKLDILKIFQNQRPRVSVAYARVSSRNQSEDLERQKEFLRLNLDTEVKIISDLGSGMNFKKRGLNQVLDLILSQSLDKIYVTHQDRLLRFGFDLVERIANKFGTEIVVLKNQEESFEGKLTTDLLEIITVFSSRFYSSRSHKNKKLIK